MILKILYFDYTNATIVYFYFYVLAKFCRFHAASLRYLYRYDSYDFLFRFTSKSATWAEKQNSTRLLGQFKRGIKN